MTPERWQKVQEVFDLVLSRGPQERAELLEQVCTGDLELRQEVESLLAWEGKENLIQNVFDGAAELLRPEGAEPPAGPMLGRQIGVYRLTAVVGQGGMGVVYKAHDSRLNRTVALKFLNPHLSLDPVAKQRFLLEARAAAALEHPNICTIYEIGETAEGQLFIAMAWYDGETLSEKAQRGPLPVQQAVDIALQTAQGLEHAHAAGIVHRDIKPANVMVTRDGVVKLLDFGVAKMTGVDLTQARVVPGTPAYMSPEQVLGRAVDRRSDIWSLGAVLYEMFTGQPPFGGDMPAVLHSITSRDPAPMASSRSGVPLELERIVSKALARDPQNRYGNTQELVRDLKALRDNPERARRAGSIFQAALRRRAWLFGTAALLSVLLAAVVHYWPTGGPGTSVASVAVLPFTDLSPKQDQGYFADGMTDALIADLAQIEALHVISRTSAMQYKGLHRPIPEIARELGVDAVVEGSVLADGHQVRIGVSLVDGRTDQTLWAHKYDRESRSVLALQREVALAISREIRIKLAPDDQTYLHQTPSVVPEAYRLYLKGVQLRYKDSPEDWQQAADSFRQATALDPGFAPAYAELARTCALLGGFTPLLTRERAIVEGKQAIVKALQHDPNLSDAYGVKGLLHEVLEWDWLGAEHAFKRAIELNPGNSQARYEYGWLLTRVGRFEEALHQFKRSIQQDPRAALTYHSLAHVYLYLRQYDQAIEQFQTALQLDPGYTSARSSLGQAYLLSGRQDKALVELEAVGIQTSGPWDAGYLAVAYATLGRKEQFLKVMAELERRWKRGQDDAAWSLALAHGGLGQTDQACKWLTIAYEKRSGNLVFLKVEPMFVSLHTTPCYQSLLKQVGLAG
jgi:eukaryotic-like serine/threonine-protein kinase